MLVNKQRYQSIWIDNLNKVKIIDQTLLPFEFKVIELESLESTAEAIINMRVRGAPLIGVTAAFGMYLSIKKSNEVADIVKARDYLVSTRPTAINLKWAVDRVVEKIIKTRKEKREAESLAIAKKMHLDDQGINEMIGNAGADVIKKIYEKKNKTINILTHCNAGWLATVDWGTATAPIYKARDLGVPIHVWVDETRPRNQGSFLTSWELNNENIENTIVVDNAGGHLMQNDQIDLVITGSDRTTYTGDVCNKIGTYLKALAAYDNGIPFYVALPSSTIDWNTSGGNMIKIEERDQHEVHSIRGIDDKKILQDIRVTPHESIASNFAFDVTPSKYITGLITEFGLLGANESEILSLKEKTI